MTAWLQFIALQIVPIHRLVALIKKEC